MRTATWLFILVVSTITAFGCAGDSPTHPGDPLVERQLPEDIQPAAAEVVQANNAFAVDIYRALAGEEGNLFLSPFSISTAFAMLHAGARGETESQMAQVFHFPQDQSRMHDAFHALLVSLNRGIDFGGYRLDVANQLWGQVGFPFLDDYLAVTREKYLADLVGLDFAADPEAARMTINDWVAEQTQDRIQDLMPEGSINALTVLVLTNAVYFKGTWETQFDPDRTTELPFYVNGTEKVTVPTMMRTGPARVGAGDGVSVLELPYSGEDLSMIVLLPEKRDGLAALEKQLTPEALAAWIGSIQAKEEFSIQLPRFQVESKFALNQVLAEMGMPDAFTGQADFSGIDGRRDLFVQAAIHQAFVKVNEEGTEAAAATGISVGRTSVPEFFQADHPFLFLIHDNVTGSILFLGRVVDPRG